LLSALFGSKVKRFRDATCRSSGCAGRDRDHGGRL
jgi:hypothetical protein